MKLIAYQSKLLLAIATGVVLSSCSSDQHTDKTASAAPVEVTVGVPSNQPLNTIQVSGVIEPQETAAISTRMMGLITSIRARVGDKVEKGSLLVTISNGDILAKREQSRAMVRESEAAFQDAQKDYERFTALYKTESASKKEYENAELHYNAAKAQAQTAQEMLKEVEDMLSYTNLTAPFSGVIVKKDIDVGSMATPGLPILVIEQSGSYQASASVSEADIEFITKGANAEIVLKANGRNIKGTVGTISPSSLLSGGQYQLKVSIPQHERDDLYSGMYVSISLASTRQAISAEQTVLVPTSAVVYKDQLAGLFTISEGQTALLRWVKTGKTYGDKTEILSGLRKDETFILDSKGKLYNGVPITVN